MLKSYYWHTSPASAIHTAFRHIPLSCSSVLFWKQDELNFPLIVPFRIFEFCVAFCFSSSKIKHSGIFLFHPVPVTQESHFLPFGRHPFPFTPWFPTLLYLLHPQPQQLFPEVDVHFSLNSTILWKRWRRLFNLRAISKRSYQFGFASVSSSHSLGRGP